MSEATQKPQPVAATGGVHLRPDGRECAYLGTPSICTKCGALLVLEDSK